MDDDRDLFDYGEGKTREEEAIDSAMMLGAVLLLTLAILLGLLAGVALTLWLT